MFFNISRVNSRLLHLNRFCRQYSYSINEIDKTLRIDLENGNPLVLSAGGMTHSTNGTGICAIGDSSVLAIVDSSTETKSWPADVVPFTVTYRQSCEAAGLSSTGLLLKNATQDIITSRSIDRSLRPLFPTDCKHEVFLSCSLLEYDWINRPEVLGINASSLALALSDLPWNGPVGAVRVGLIDNTYVLNPTQEQLEESSLDIVVAGSGASSVVMIEGKADIVPYHKVYKALEFGVKACDSIVKAIEAFAEKFGKPKQQYKKPEPIDAEVVDSIQSLAEVRLVEVFQNYGYDKTSRDDAVSEIRQHVLNHIISLHPNIEANTVANEFDKVVKKIFREITFNGKRCDGRGHNQLRNITCSVDLFKPLHGSSLFEFGETKVMATVALDSPKLVFSTGTFTDLRKGKRSQYWLEYRSPPHVNGEIGGHGKITRREVGHGRLAENALCPVIPENHPFTIKVLAEVMESNGSSSMATVCAGSLALMDAGVPIKNAVAGVAIGLITKYDADDPKKLIDYRILTDIMGMEDYLGDLDMKIASTSDGITAIQTDIRTNGLPIAIFNECMERAHAAKKQILQKMTERLPIHKTKQKDCWPVMKHFKTKMPVRTNTGKGRNLLKLIQEEGGYPDFMAYMGGISVFVPSQAEVGTIKAAVSHFNKICDIDLLKRGRDYSMKIVELADNGVMVQLNNAMEPAFIPLNQLDKRSVAHPADLGLAIGHVIKVKYFGKDPKTGNLRLSKTMVKTITRDMIIRD